MAFISKMDDFLMDATLYGMDCSKCGVKMVTFCPTHYASDTVWTCPECKTEVSAKELLLAEEVD